MFSQHLTDRAVITLSGSDSIPFLQGLVTNDVSQLSKDSALYAALLSPQGKFLHDFLLVADEDRILIDIHAARAGDLLARLKMYKLRSKVSFSLSELQVSAFWDTASPPQVGGIMVTDPRAGALGYRLYSDVPVTPGDAGDYEAHRIALGIPDGARDMRADKSLLMEYGFEALHGVSFSKGCYVGQEVTARSKFRGAVRKQLYKVRAQSPLPANGTLLVGSGVTVGELLSVSGTQGLALMRPEDLEKISGPVTADGVSVFYTTPEWNRPAAA